MDNLAEHRSDLFRNLLNVLWLRPERALVDAHQLVTALELLGTNFAQPSLEYGCTEGVNTFVMFGGEFDFSHDDYFGVNWDQESHIRSNRTDDYYDTVEETYVPKIKTLPKNRITVGVSWRDAHIEKARNLGVFRQTEKVELNSPLTQFDDNSFCTIWSPNLFWSSCEALEMLIQEHKRILKTNGRIVTILPDQGQKNHVLEQFAPQIPKRYQDWLESLDRGRISNLTRHAYSLEDWAQVFEKCGLSITKHRRFLPSLVGEIYEIGFRPMFPVFMNIREALQNAPSADFLDIKKQWIDTCFHFLSPMCDSNWAEALGSKPLWHAFELTSV